MPEGIACHRGRRRQSATVRDLCATRRGQDSPFEMGQKSRNGFPDSAQTNRRPTAPQSGTASHVLSSGPRKVLERWSMAVPIWRGGALRAVRRIALHTGCVRGSVVRDGRTGHPVSGDWGSCGHPATGGASAHAGTDARGRVPCRTSGPDCGAAGTCTARLWDCRSWGVPSPRSTAPARPSCRLEACENRRNVDTLPRQARARDAVASQDGWRSVDRSTSGGDDPYIVAVIATSATGREYRLRETRRMISARRRSRLLVAGAMVRMEKGRLGWPSIRSRT